MHLDPKALEAATAAYNETIFTSDTDHTSRIIRAYISASIPAEIGRLPQRLKALAEHLKYQPLAYADDVDPATIREAASTLLSLSARVGELEKALEPFSRFAGPVFERNFNKPDTITSIGAADGGYCTLTAGDFFAARAALTRPAPTHEDGSGEKIDLSALDAWFPNGVPMVAVKIMFPEKSEPLSTEEVRHVLAALALSHTSGEATEAKTSFMRDCATDGCDKKASVRFERGGVGSEYCHDCYMRVQSLRGAAS